MHKWDRSAEHKSRTNEVCSRQDTSLLSSAFGNFENNIDELNKINNINDCLWEVHYAFYELESFIKNKPKNGSFLLSYN